MKDITKTIKSSESSISTILGILVVVVVGVLLFNYFKNTIIDRRQTGEEQLQTEEKKTIPSEEQKTVSLPTKYTVVKDDSLWKISTKFFGDGYNWIDISRENGIKNPNLLSVGQSLNIPDVQAKKALSLKPTISQSLIAQPITENTYTVVKGDNLWKISVRTYQDGFKWPEIAKANKLSNPNLIHPGNILVIPR